MQNFTNFFYEIRTDEPLDDCFSVTVSIVGLPSSRSDRKHNYKQLHFEIIDTTITMPNDWFAGCTTFEFLDLVNPQFFWHWQNNVPCNKLQLLNDKYGPLFDISTLESQLLFIYKDPDIHKESPVEFLLHIFRFNLHPSVPAVVKLLKLNAILAVSSASVEGPFSSLRRVKSYLCGQTSEECLGSLYTISIHKDIEEKGPK